MSEGTTFRISRKGALAVELMSVYHGAKLTMAVERIVRDGPLTEVEKQAVNLVNLRNFDDPLIRT